MESSTYTDKKYIEASRMWVNVAAHSEKTHEVDANVGGKRVTVCSAYWNIPCEVHSKCYAASGKFEDIRTVPTTIFADSTGKEIARASGNKSASELIKQQNEILNKIPGDKISIDEWNLAKKTLDEAESHVAKTEWKKAIELFTRVSKMQKKVLKEKGSAGLERLNTKGRDLILEGKAKIESDKEEAKKILKMVAADFKPLECAKEATAVLKEIPADEKK